MDRSIILLLLNLIFFSFVTASLSLYFKGSGSENSRFEGTLYEQPILDGRYKKINISDRKIYLSQFAKVSQGDYVTVDFATCTYSEKFKNYTNCDIKVDPSKQNNFLKQLLALREALVNRAKVRLPNPHDYLLLAMTIGYEDNLPDSLTDKLRDIGAIHMLVVSGYNVSLILNSSAAILKRFSRPMYVLSSLLLLIIFILITGFDPPILRAVIMGTFVVVSRALNRPGAAIYLLFLSAVIMLSWNPTYISNLSFQLSFMATLGVIIFSQLFGSSDLMVSIGASTFVLPILSYYFGTLNVLGIISSIFLGWLVPLITYLGFLVFLSGNILVRLAFVVVADLFLQTADLISKFTFLNINFQIGVRDLCLYYTGVAMILFCIHKVKKNLNKDNG